MQCSGGKEGVSSGDECREETRCAADGCKVRWDEEEKERKEKKEEVKDGVVQQQAGGAGGKRERERKKGRRAERARKMGAGG